MKNKIEDSVRLNQINEVIDYCYAIRAGIFWIAETIMFSKQYVGWKIPKEAAGEGDEINWVEFESKSPEQYKAFIALELFSGLNNDLLHFTNYSLKSLHPAHIAVSYTLARKPYRDSLIYLEYLYARPEEFLEIFLGNHKTLKTKDLDKKVKDENLRKALIKESCEKIKKAYPLSLSVQNPDYLYEFRYKVDYTGFYDSATHLITSRNNNATSDVNMNFIFLNNETETAEQHAAHLLRIHLTNLNYGLDLMYELLHTLMKEFFSEEDFKKFEEYFKYVLFKRVVSGIATMYGHRLLSDGSLDRNHIISLMRLLKHILKFECLACGSKKFIDSSLKAAEILIFDEALLCKVCKYPCTIEHPLRLTVEY